MIKNRNKKFFLALNQPFFPNFYNSLVLLMLKRLLQIETIVP